MATNKKNKNVNDELLAFVNENIDVFEENYQSKFIKVFIEDRNNWNQQIMDIIFPEYFEGYHKLLIDYQISFFRKYRVPADYNELKELVNDRERDELVKDHLYGLIDKIKLLDLEHQKRESVKERAYSYFKSKKMKNTLIELALDWKKNTFDSMKNKLEEALRAGEPKDSGHSYAKDYKKRLKENLRNVISILPGLDEHIDGGVGNGELTLIMAPTGGGKSMMLVQNAVTALLANKKVVYYTLELSEEVVGQRFDACFNKIPLRNVTQFEEVIIEKIAEVGDNLIIKHFPDGVATVNSFYAHLDYIKCNDNFIPDLIVVDYADNMKPLVKGEQLRHDLMQIYRELRALGIENHCPVLTASQITGEIKKDIELNMAAEAKGKSNICDLVIGFGRDGDQIINNEASLKILKNRNGPIGRVLPITFDSSMVFIEVKSETTFTPHEKRAMIGKDIIATKQKDAKNVDIMMNNMSQLLNNQTVV